VDEAHLRGALGLNPLDAEVLNLYGVAHELGGDVSSATRAYRAAFACDPDYGRARRNLERVSDQFAYIGLIDDARLDLFTATSVRVAVPIFDPVRDLPLCRTAKLIGGPTSGVALGIVFDPPTEEGGPTRTIARRRGYVRAAGRHDHGSVPCLVHYAFAVDRGEAARALGQEERCELTLIGKWAPEIVRAALKQDERLVLASAWPELPGFEAVRPALDGAASIALAVAVNLAITARVAVLLPGSLAEAVRVTSLPAHALFGHAQLSRPFWVQSDSYVTVRADRAGTDALNIGATAEAAIQILL
jgi:hypothetical protein